MSFISEQGRLALTKVAEWLEAGAPHVDADGRHIDDFNMNYSLRDTGCGTSCCIAGAVYQFEGLHTHHPEWFEDLGPVVKDYLQIDPFVAGQLFEPWAYFNLQANRDEGESISSPYNDTALAARVIRHFLATGVVDWNI